MSEQRQQRPSTATRLPCCVETRNSERATQVGRGRQAGGMRELLQFLSPLGWEHINSTGDYVWRQSRADWKTGSFGPYGCPKTQRARFFRICGLYLICARQNVKTAAPTSPAKRQRARGRRADPRHGPRATPQQERQKAAREAERGREADARAGRA